MDLVPTKTTTPATVEARGFSKALKGLPVRVEVTVRDPENDSEIKMILSFRRMKDGEATRMQERIALWSAMAREIEEAGDADGEAGADAMREAVGGMIDTLAPVFLDQKGIDDFPGVVTGSPEARFRTYFGGDGTELAEDLIVEAKIVQAAYYGYLRGAFRLVPAELVATVPLLQRRDAEGGEVASN